MPHFQHDSYDSSLDDPDAIRGEIDTGAKVTCTNLLYILHDYTPYTAVKPSPLRLKGAIASDSNSIVPLGHGYIRLPSPNRQGYIAVRSYYHPDLTSTLISENDILNSSGQSSSYTGLNLTKWIDPGTFTITCHHRVTFCKNITLHGVLIAGKCYSHPCLIPDLPITHPEATIYNSQAFALKYDPAFLALCKARVIADVRQYKSSKRDLLRDCIKSIPRILNPNTFSTVTSPIVNALSPTCLPFQHRHKTSPPTPTERPIPTSATPPTSTERDSPLVSSFQDVPILAIKNRTCRMLWHQRLGHPCDSYLYTAYKSIDGVPQFLAQPPVLSTCPTCIQAKQTKSAPGHHSTHVAIQPYQGLSIDYGFSGMMSANSDRRKDFEGLNKEAA